MRSSVPAPIMAAALLATLATTAGAAPDDEEASGATGRGMEDAPTESADPLPGEIRDRDIVVPPGKRAPYSGAPADWENAIKDSEFYTYSTLDRLEYGASDEGDSYLWDAQGWAGGDYHKFWWKTEGEGEAPISGDPEVAELQALYYRTIAPFWGLQAGLRHDLTDSGPDRTHAVLGLQGLAPYWFETAIALFVSEEGDTSLRGEVEYDFMLTQRLILQPRLEFNASAGDVPELGLASGLNDTEMGLRLRYEIVREFAPYVGVRWSRLHGDTRDIANNAGEPTSVTSFVLGVRAWF